MIKINFTGNINNTSLQVNDLAYYVSPSLSGGFDQSTEPPKLIGNITVISSNFIRVDNSSTNETPEANDFIMFAKDTRVNLSGIVGYYAEVKIKNNSVDKAEMFSIASEVSPSSK